MSSFDFAVQFLDADRMTYWGKHQDINFWTENASVKWKESEAPFHLVARLTLQANSALSREASDGVYFDVTGHCTADSQPVGSIESSPLAGRGRQQESALGDHARS